MEIFPGRKIERRMALTAVVCALASLPGLLRGGRALITVPVVWVGGAIYFVLFRRRYVRRRRLAEMGLDDWARKILEDRVSFYRSLPDSERKRYEAEIAVFLDEHRIVGVDDVEVTPEARVLVAASGVRLTFGRPSWEYPDFGEILLYPGRFRPDRTFSTDVAKGEPAASGLVHGGGGVIISLPDLLKSFEGPKDGYNVGYHEFAHLLDGFPKPSGVPCNLSLGAYRGWIEVMQKEFDRTRQGDSPLRSYAGTDPAEFFACATEAFFESPERLRANSPDLYRELAAYFNQEPRSAWSQSEPRGN
ncbi:hypothetical protein GF402_05440 [Candidatus Fermentibacteria bacterium]|nr:hypothetical protein [Candidatus Fermentibacteria bacterium]